MNQSGANRITAQSLDARTIPLLAFFSFNAFHIPGKYPTSLYAIHHLQASHTLLPSTVVWPHMVQSRTRTHSTCSPSSMGRPWPSTTNPSRIRSVGRSHDLLQFVSASSASAPSKHAKGTVAMYWFTVGRSRISGMLASYSIAARRSPSRPTS